MTYPEYEEIAKTLTNENAPDIVKQFLDNIKSDLENRDALAKLNDDNDKKIRDLQDTNIKLFLSQTGKADDDADNTSEEEEQKHVEDEIEKMLKGE